MFKSTLRTGLILIAIVIVKSSIAGEFSYGPLETVTEFNDYREAGVTVTPQGRVLVSMHPLDNPTYSVIEVMANGTKRPFPTVDWADGPNIGKVGMTAVIGIHSDKRGIVWMLDMGDDQHPTQLVAWDTIANKLSRKIVIPKTSLESNSFAQDFVIDEKRGKIYIADMSLGNFVGEPKPAIIVVDIKTGISKRVLESIDAFLSPPKDVVINATVLASKGNGAKTNKLYFGLNPIAIDDNYDWVYFATMNGTDIYRIPTKSLVNDTLSREALEAKIERFGPKNPSDGMLYVPKLGVVVTDLEHNAVGLSVNNTYKVLIKNKQLSWPDSLAVSGDYIYVTQNELHLHPAFSQGLGNSKPPYKLMRFKYK
ncbi:L-dopachrome tautomerase-related protein [Vibrio sp. ER1A]|uniref:L-dopachrome tautomerase-related protein n=1 Tax=Vibrio sp. ER1A TaxID=1517681 RepID=UPI0004DD57A7|nr:L-dopachrome tautomerase-related protein [Vibrio sp. ER1A]KFA94931.1 hypothetical protein HW45_28585 [Vibrio sp. ER1A]